MLTQPSSPHVPYRDSKLTMLLCGALEARAKVRHTLPVFLRECAIERGAAIGHPSPSDKEGVEIGGRGQSELPFCQPYTHCDKTLITNEVLLLATCDPRAVCVYVYERAVCACVYI